MNDVYAFFGEEKDLEKILNQTRKFIGNISGAKYLDVQEIFNRYQAKLIYRTVSKAKGGKGDFHLSDKQEVDIKLKAWGLTGRACRRYFNPQFEAYKQQLLEKSKGGYK